MYMGGSWNGESPKPYRFQYSSGHPRLGWFVGTIQKTAWPITISQSSTQWYSIAWDSPKTTQNRWLIIPSYSPKFHENLETTFSYIFPHLKLAFRDPSGPIYSQLSAARNLVEDGHRDNLRLHLKDLRTRPPHEMGNMKKTCGFSGFTWKNWNLDGFSDN